MKILVVSDRFAPLHAGGAARVAAALAHEYKRADHEVVIAHGDPTGRAPHEGEISGLKARWVSAPIGKRRRGWLSIHNPRALGQLRRIVSDEKPDVAHAHNLHEAFSFAALGVLAEAGVPTVLTLHDCLSFHQGKFVEIAQRPRWQTDDAQLRLSALDLLRRYRLRYVPGRRRRIRAIIEQSGALVVAVSHLLRRVLLANRVPCHDVIHNGVRAEECRGEPEVVERLRGRLGLGGRRMVATFGRLTAAKGQAQVLRAMRRVHREMPEAVLLTVGTPTAALPGKAPLVVGTEPLSGRELAAAYGLAAIVAVPSVCLDVFPTVALEAMAAGRPVVVSCFAGTSEIIEEGQTGFVVNPLDVEALAERLRLLLRDSARAAQVGEAGRRLVEERYTIERCACRYLELLEGLLSSRAA